MSRADMGMMKANAWWWWNSNSEDENDCVLDGVDDGDKDDDIDFFDEEVEGSKWCKWRLRGTGIGLMTMIMIMVHKSYDEDDN